MPRKFDPNTGKKIDSFIDTKGFKIKKEGPWIETSSVKIDLEKKIENLDEKELIELNKGLKDLADFAKEGAGEMLNFMQQIGASSGFTVPFQVFCALLQQHPLTIEAIKELVGILKEREFASAIGYIGSGIKTLADLFVACTRIIRRLVEMWINFIAILQKMFTEPEGVIPSPPGYGLGGPWWWCSIIIGIVCFLNFIKFIGGVGLW